MIYTYSSSVVVVFHIFLSKISVSFEADLQLAYSADCMIKCPLNDEDLNQGIVCKAAHYSNKNNFDDLFTKENISLRIQSVPDADGCTSPSRKLPLIPQALLLTRGGCSFYEKANYAQSSGFGALVLADYQEMKTLIPPGLGDEGGIHIPVVMISKIDADRLLRKNATCDGNLLFSILFSKKDEASLWEKSPWHGSKSEQQQYYSLLNLNGSHYMPTCSANEVALFSDASWLYQKWLNKIDCHNFFDHLPNCVKEENVSACIKRLHVYDASSTPLPDPILLNIGRDLSLLNSKSHQFSFGSNNIYQKSFKGFIIELRGGAYVDIDGLVVTQDGSTFHAGGCGCCPLQVGEINVKRSSSKPPIIRAKKIISLVQRSQNVYYHFVLEVLPRLMFALDYTQSEPEILVLVDKRMPFASFYLEELMGLAKSQILGYEQENIYFAEELLILPSPLPCMHVPPVPLKSLRDSYFKSPGTCNGENRTEASSSAQDMFNSKPKMIVLQRKGPRKIRNFEELFRALSEHCSHKFNVTTYFCENKTVSEQRIVFSAASVLLASHGSGISNAIFMLEQSTLIELLPWEYTNLSFYLLTCALGFRHYIHIVDDCNAFSSLLVNIDSLIFGLKLHKIC